MEVSDENIEMLRAMGFSNDEENRRALQFCSNDINNAVNWLLNNDTPSLPVVNDSLPFSDGRGPLAPQKADDISAADFEDSSGKRDTDAYAAGFPTQSLFELEGRVFTESWSIPYKRNEALGRCLFAAIQFANVNFLDADPDASRFIQRCLPECLQKLMSSSAVLEWSKDVLDGIVDMLELLVELTAKRLRYLPVQHDLLKILALVFRTDTEYHSKTRTRYPRERSEWLTWLRTSLNQSEKSSLHQPISDVFAYTPLQYREPYGYLVNLINEFAAHGGFSALQTILLQTVASGLGVHCGATSTQASIFDLAVLIAPFANCFEFLTAYTVREYIAPLVMYAYSLVATQQSELNVSLLEPALKDKKAYLVFDLLRTLKLVASKLRVAPEDVRTAFAAVGGELHTFVDCNFDRLRLDLCLLMLRSEHFNARMNTLKELERFVDVLHSQSTAGRSGVVLTNLAVSQLEREAQIDSAEFEAWLAENRVIEFLILEGNLDQQQYLEKIKTVVEYMSTRLSIDEIEQIWSLQFQTQSMLDNVFSLLAIAAAKFSETQFDHLYSLIQRSWLAPSSSPSRISDSASPASASASEDFAYDFQLKEKLILMLSKIARETKDPKIIHKLLEILWDLAFVHSRPFVAGPGPGPGQPSDSGIEISNVADSEQSRRQAAKRRAFLERLILLILNEHLAVLNESNFVPDATRRMYAQKCIENIKSGAQYVAPSINQLIQIMRSIAKTTGKPEKSVLQQMNTNYEIVRMVIGSLTNLIRSLEAPHVRIAPDLVVDGLCTLYDSIKIHLEFLRYVLKEAELYLTCVRATELFNCLILRFHNPLADSVPIESASELPAAEAQNPAVTTPIPELAPKLQGNTDFIQDLAADWFRVSIGDLEPETQTILFKKNFAVLNYKQLTVKGFLSFRDYFEKVNLHAKRLKTVFAAGPLSSSNPSSFTTDSQQMTPKYVVERADLYGIEFCWQLALNSERMTVARGAIQLLLNVSYSCLSPRLRRGSGDVQPHIRFVQDCEQRMLREPCLRGLFQSEILEQAMRAATHCLVDSIGGSSSSALRDALAGARAASSCESDVEDASLMRIERLLLIIEQYIARVEDDFEAALVRDLGDKPQVRRFIPHSATFFGVTYPVRLHVIHDAAQTPTAAMSGAARFCELLLYCHSNETLASLYRRVAAQLCVPVATVQLSIAGSSTTKDKERRTSGSGNSAQEKTNSGGNASGSSKDRPLPNVKYCSSRLLLDVLRLGVGVSRGRTPLLNVRLTSTSNSARAGNFPVVPLTAATVASVDSASTFCSIEIEKQLPSVLIARDSRMFELLFGLVQLQHCGILRNLHRLIRRLPSDPIICSTIASLLKPVTSASADGDGDGDSRSQSLAAFRSYVATLLDAKQHSLFRLVHNLEILSAAMMPAVNIQLQSPVGNEAEFCHAELLTMSESFTRAFAEAGCIDLLVQLLEFDWPKAVNTDASAGNVEPNRAREVEYNYELLLHVYTTALQMLRFLLVGWTPLRPLDRLEAVDVELPRTLQSGKVQVQWSHLFALLLRLACNTALRDCVLDVEVRSHRSSDLFDAAYYHQQIAMQAFSLLLAVVVRRLGVESLLGTLYSLPCFAKWLIQLLVDCPNSEIRSFVARCLVDFCHSYETTQPEGIVEREERPKEFLLRLLLNAKLACWSTTLMLRCGEKQSSFTQCYDYFALCACLLTRLTRAEQSLLSITCVDLLKVECDWLISFLPRISNSCDTYRHDSVTTGAGTPAQFRSVEECMLTGHLEVLHALLTCEGADKAVVGNRLIGLLIRDCLFPASSLLLAAEHSTRPSVTDLHQRNVVEREVALLEALQASLSSPSSALHLLPKARSPLARSRCMRVVEELCRGCVENLEKATACLLELHHTFDKQTLTAESSASGDASSARPVSQFDINEAYTDWEYNFTLCERNVRGVTQGEANKSEAICGEAAAMEEEMTAGVSRVTCDDLIGLRNGGATCYMNSILQQLFMQPGVCEYLLSISTDRLEDGNILFQTQQVFAYLKHALFEHYAPKQFWHHFRWNYSMTQSINTREQQDAYDFLTSLIDQLDLQLEKLKKDEIFKLHYQGSFTDLKECEGGCSHRFEREQDFYGLNLSIKTGSLLDALKESVQVETLEGANAYYCAHCNEKRRTKKRMLISKLPEVLTMQLKRFDFDWDAQKPVKFNDYFAFPFRLNMKPFTTASLNQSGPSPSAAVSATIAAEEDDPEFAYELVGIVIHSGMQANAGHYYSFIKDRRGGSVEANPHFGRWYKFNDTTIEQFDSFDQAKIARAGPGYIDAALEYECFGGTFKQTFATPTRDSSNAAAKFPSSDSDFDSELHEATMRHEETNSLIQNIFKVASINSFAMSDYAQPGSVTSLPVSVTNSSGQSGSNLTDERTRYWNAYLLFYERVLKEPQAGAALHPVLTPSKRKPSTASLSTLPLSSPGITAASASTVHRLFIPSATDQPMPSSPPVQSTSVVSPLAAARTRSLSSSSTPVASDPVAGGSTSGELPAQAVSDGRSRLVSVSEDTELGVGQAADVQSVSAGGFPPQPKPVLHPFEVRALYTPYHRWSQIASRRIQLHLLLDNLLFFKQRNVFCKEYFRFARLLVQSGTPSVAIAELTEQQDEQLARIASHFAIAFLTNTFYRAYRRLRDGEQDVWKELFSCLISRSRTACALIVDYLVSVTPSSQVISTFLLRCPQQQVRSHFGSLFESLLHTVRKDQQTDAIDRLIAAFLEPIDNGELASNVTRSSSYFLVPYSFLTYPTNEIERLENVRFLTRHSIFSRLANFLIVACTGNLASTSTQNISQTLTGSTSGVQADSFASTSTASLTNSQSVVTLRKAFSREQLREFNGYLFAVLGELLAVYDCSPSVGANNSIAVPVFELDSLASHWLGSASQTHLLLAEALIFVREHYLSASPVSTTINSSLPITLHRVAMQLVDAFARISVQNRQFGEQLIGTALQQLETAPTVLDINTLLHILHLEASVVAESSEIEAADESQSVKTPHWRLRAIADGLFATSTSTSNESTPEMTRRFNGLLQIIENEQERDTRKAYLCMKFLVQQAQRFEALRAYLLQIADRWQWCCDWLRNLMVHGIEGVAEARRLAASGATLGAAATTQPNGGAVTPVGRTINYGSFQRTNSSTITLRDAIGLLHPAAVEAPDVDADAEVETDEADAAAIAAAQIESANQTIR